MVDVQPARSRPLWFLSFTHETRTERAMLMAVTFLLLSGSSRLTSAYGAPPL